MKIINLDSLLPEFSGLLAHVQGEGNFDTEVLSAVFVVFIALVFFGFLLYSFCCGFLPARRRIRKIKQLVAGLTPDDLLSSRGNTLEMAQSISAARTSRQSSAALHPLPNPTTITPVLFPFPQNWKISPP